MTKRWKYGLLALSLAVTTAACADDRTPNADRPAGAGTPGAAGTAGAAPAADANREGGIADRNFITDMMASGHAEVELARLAQQKASNRQVKEFAAMLVRDHEKANAELKTVAQQASIDTSDVAERKDDKSSERERFAGLSGAEFDREYMKKMVDDHERSVNKVEDKADGANNDHIKQWAAKTLPTLKKHLEEARQIHDSLEKRSRT